MPEIKVTYDSAPSVVIESENKKQRFSIAFRDDSTGRVLSRFDDVEPGKAVSPDRQHYVDWSIAAMAQDQSWMDVVKVSFEGKNVLLLLQSSALGDCIAWMPYVEEFRKKLGCNLTVANKTWGFFFEQFYPEINFVTMEEGMEDIHATFRVMYFLSGELNNWCPIDCRVTPLQEVGSTLLGQKYTEIRPDFRKHEKPIIEGDYVVITDKSTMKMKEWNRSGGWQKVVDFLIEGGFKVINVGEGISNLTGVENMKGRMDMDKLCNIIEHSKFFIGLPSGLSWLAWGLRKKVVMIVGMSEPFCEFKEDMYRVQNFDVCNGCFNSIKHHVNNHDFEWCPEKKAKRDKFECTKMISPKMVFVQISKVLIDLNVEASKMSVA